MLVKTESPGHVSEKQITPKVKFKEDKNNFKF